MQEPRYRLRAPDGRLAGYGLGSHTVSLGDGSVAYVYASRDDAIAAARAFGAQLGVPLSIEEYWSDQDNGLRVGDRVRFTTPASPEERRERFVVLELRKDRALVRAAESGMHITPTFVYLLSDLAVDR